MAWSDAARKAAALARKRNRKYGSFTRKEDSDLRRDWERDVRKQGLTPYSRHLSQVSQDYTTSVRSQLSARQRLVKMGRHPITGKKVGLKAAKAAMAKRGDYEND